VPGARAGGVLKYGADGEAASGSVTRFEISWDRQLVRGGGFASTAPGVCRVTALKLDSGCYGE
jgi:hypothetical protein